MTLTDSVLREQNFQRSFSLLLLASGLAASPVSGVEQTHAEAPEQNNSSVSYTVAGATDSSRGTLDVSETFVTERDLIESLVNLHDSLASQEVQLDEREMELLTERVDELYA